MSKTEEYYDFFSEIVLRHRNDKLEEENKKDDMEQSMIGASNKARLTRNQLIDMFFEEGVMAIYKLGMKHMYEYLKGE